MTIIKKYLILSGSFLLLSIPGIKAQSTYSPYSMLGLGEIESNDYGKTAGMANIGIGVRLSDYLNPYNPAALSGLESNHFYTDVAVSGKYSSFSRRSNKDETFNGNLKKVAIGLKPFPIWGISVGLKPFSDVGYQIYSEEPIEGSNATKDVYIEGKGGLYTLYLSNGIKISKNLSLGINTMYISGSIKQTENQGEYLFQKESQTTNIYNTFGLQYHNRHGLTVGATYGYKQNLTMKNKTLIYNSSGSLLQEEKDRSSSQFIPESMGVGFSYDHKKFLWGMDFKYEKWDGLKSGVNSVRITDSYKINAGVGYTLNNRVVNQKRKQLQAGGSFSRSYIKVSDEPAYNYSISAGYTFPLNKSENQLGLFVEYGNSFSAPSGYIRESYFALTINWSISERWFMKNKIR